jgi:hypothetical protein
MSFLIKLTRHPFLNTDCQRGLGPSGKYCFADAKKRSHIDDGRDKSRRFSLSFFCAVFLSNTLRLKLAGTKLLSPANIITFYIFVIKLVGRSAGGGGTLKKNVFGLCCSKVFVCGTLFQTAIFHGTPTLF